MPRLPQSDSILSYHFERMRRGTPRLYNNNNIYKMKILLFDNYDSFTYNLLHILKELGADVEVHRNDKISLEEIERFDKILLSPGPGIPEEAGILLPLIRRYAPTKSILGVCLGGTGTGYTCWALSFLGGLQGKLPGLSGNHGGRYGRRTDHGLAPS